MSIASDFYTTDKTIVAGETTYEFTKPVTDLYNVNDDFDNSITYAKCNVPVIDVSHALGGSNKGWNWESFTFDNGGTAFFKPSNDNTDGTTNVLFAIAECGRGVQGYDHSLQWGKTNNSDTVMNVNASYIRFLKNGEFKNFCSWITFNGYKISDNMAPVTISITDLYENADDYLISGIRNYVTNYKNTTSTSQNSFFPVFILDDNIYTGVFTLKNLFNHHSTPNINMKNKAISGGNSAFLYANLDRNYLREFDTPDLRLTDIDTTWDKNNPVDTTNYHILGENDKVIIRGKYGASYNNTTGEITAFSFSNTERLVKGSYALKLLAYTGVFYTDDTPNGKPWEAFNSHVYCGYMASNGITTGVMLRGEDIEESDTAQKKYRIDNNSFDPNYNPVSDDDIIKSMKSNTSDGIHGRITYYTLNDVQFKSFCDDVSEITDDPNIMNNLVCCYTVPRLCEPLTTTTNMPIKIGGHTLTTHGNKVITQNTYTIASFNVPSRHNNAYDTLTKYYLYTPYTDVIPLNYKCYGRTITVELHPSIPDVTASLTVKADGMIIFKQGISLGNAIPVVTENNAEKNNAIIQSGIKYAGSALSFAGGIATGNPIAIGGGALGIVSSTVNAMNAVTTTHNHSYGSNTGSSIWLMPSKVYLIEHVVKLDKPDNFAHTVGNLCNKAITLYAGMGFTQLQNPRINTSLTVSEKTELNQMLEKGVIL